MTALTSSSHLLDALLRERGREVIANRRYLRLIDSRIDVIAPPVHQPAPEPGKRGKYKPRQAMPPVPEGYCSHDSATQRKIGACCRKCYDRYRCEVRRERGDV